MADQLAQALIQRQQLVSAVKKQPAKRPIGDVDAGAAEDAERIAVTERVYTVVTEERQVYGCGGSGHSETALAPPQLVSGGRYDSSVAINVAVDKYVDHMPLNRQVRAMRRAGLRTTRQAM